MNKVELVISESVDLENEFLEVVEFNRSILGIKDMVVYSIDSNTGQLYDMSICSKDDLYLFLQSMDRIRVDHVLIVFSAIDIQSHLYKCNFKSFNEFAEFAEKLKWLR